MAFVEVQNISKTFGSGNSIREVLKHVSLSVDQGEFVSIMGFTGSGKTTFLNIVSGLTPPDSGTVRIGGRDVRGVHPRAAVVFQNYSLLPWFSAFENVRLAVEAAFPEWTAARQAKQAHQYLETVGLAAAKQLRPGQL